jgi:hypothetical protein
MDEDSHQAEGEKVSKRDRLKDALSRTKSKFKKEPKTKTSEEDVDDFLCAGRASADDRLPQHETSSAPTDHEPSPPSSSRPSTSDSANPFPSSPRSPRKLHIPKIDVSNSQRWPMAKVLGASHAEVNDFLRPEYQTRSQSANTFSNLKKRGARGRNLSVNFIEGPPVIIGEGGDEAPAPPVEISRSKQRARSASPMPSRGQHRANGLPEHPASAFPRQHHAPPAALQPRMLQRAPTGHTSTLGTYGSALDKEFAMTLGGGAHMTTSPDGATPTSPEIMAPTPMRVVKPPSADALGAPDQPRGMRKGTGNDDLRGQFREGDALRMQLDQDQEEQQIRGRRVAGPQAREQSN